MLKARRHRPAGVLPLELWDVLVDETPLYRVADAAQPQAIARAVEALRGGTARRLRAGSALPCLPIERVVLGGGGAVQRVQQALTQRGISALVADEPRFIAEPGGRALLRELLGERAPEQLLKHVDSSQPGMVVDVGQTAIKRWSSAGRACIERPLARVPIEDAHAEPAEHARQRADAVGWLAQALQVADRPRALVLALPCEVADDLAVAGCSYPWRAGDTTLVADVLSAAGLDQTECLVLNDAELAALSVAQRWPREPRTLVLTIGLGLGAAYLAG